MSISSEITRISQNVSDSLDAVAAKGVTVPSGSTSDDLPSLISQITTGSGSAIVVTDEADSHGGVIKHITAVNLGGDTVTADKILSGYTAHNSLGEAITGTYATNLQAKTNISPTTSSQTIRPDTGYTGLSSVQINAMPNGTAGTPSASKGTVSNHSISVTPSVTNTTGYITGGTKTGTAVTVTASELVSGSQTIIDNDTYDVTNLASVVVNVSGGSEINNQNKSVTPTESQQTVTADAGYTGLGTVTVGAISSTYVGSGITSRSSTDLTASGAIVTVPSGYYASQATKSVASGTVTAPASISGSSATVSAGTNTLTLSKTVSVTPNVSTAGYVSAGTAGNSSVSLTASVTTQAAKTVTPTTSSQTAVASGVYTTGAITVAAIPSQYKDTSDATAAAADIVSGATAYAGGSKITGSLVVQSYYTGTSTPSSSLGNNGDLYLKTS